MPDVVVVAYVPPGVRRIVGDERLTTLADAHPRARFVLADTPERFLELLSQADGVLYTGADLSRAISARLGELPRLRWFHSIPAGVTTNLTPELVAAERIAITSSKGPMGPSMAEHAAALMMALARDLPAFARDQSECRWRPLGEDGAPRTVELDGKTLLVMGVGSVGARLARICGAGLGMRVLGMTRSRRDCPHVDRYVERAELHAALGEADVVALTMPLTAETERIIDAAALAAMKPTAYLVNVSRGGLVDEGALVEALRDGRIAGAALDAFTVEPLPSESPLWSLRNVIVTPHRSPITDRVNDHLVGFWRENIRRFAGGEPLLGAVDRRAGY